MGLSWSVLYRSYPVTAGLGLYVPVKPARACPGRLVPEPEPAEPVQERTGRDLSLPEPFRDRKKRCV